MLKGGKRVGDRLDGRTYYDFVNSGIAGIGLEASKYASNAGLDFDNCSQRREHMEDGGNTSAQEHGCLG